LNDEASTTRQLIAEISGTALTTALIMIAGVTTGLLAARALGPAGRGALTAITIWPATILYAGSFGLAEATAYFTASQPERSHSVFITAQLVALGLGIVVSIAGWLLLPLILHRQDRTIQEQARIYVIFFVIPGLSSLCAAAWLQGTSQIRDLNVVRGSVHVVTALVMGMMTLAGYATVGYYAVAMLIGNLTAWMLGLRACYARRNSSFAVQRQLIRPMLSYGTKVQFGTWSSAANVRLDQLMLSALAASAPLGLYVIGLSYSGLVATVPTVAGIVMLPRLIRDCARGVGDSTFATWHRRVLWATVCLGIFLWLAARIVLPLLFGRSLEGSVSLQSLLIPASCILGMNQFLATGFRGHGLPSVGSRGELIGLLVTVPFLVALLPRYGIYGAAVTSLCAYCTVFVYLLSRVTTIVPDLRLLVVPTAEDWRIAKRAVRTMTLAVIGWPQAKGTNA
jgi:O-antigen/teichoic acid export membrane protein